MANNEQNLIPFNELSEEEHRKIASKGGKKSVEARRKKKKLKEELEILLEKTSGNMTYQEAISLALIKKALKGDTKAYEIIRDTLGQKPVDKVEHSGEIATRDKAILEMDKYLQVKKEQNKDDQ